MSVKKTTNETEELQRILDSPPADRGLDYLWTDGCNGVSQRPVAWRLFCRGDSAKQMAAVIAMLTAQLAEAVDHLERVRARAPKNILGEMEARVPRLQMDLDARRRLVEAAGGWASFGLGVLVAAAGQAEQALTEARGALDPYRRSRPPLPCPAPLVAAEKKAEAVLGEAVTARDEMLTLVDADREALRKLKTRAAA